MLKSQAHGCMCLIMLSFMSLDVGKSRVAFSGLLTAGAATVISFTISVQASSPVLAGSDFVDGVGFS
ncbi:hypothetical protein P8452_10438 [Trifolium repens]|nr:hypothetical protein P8452_10438 [Trifolium repens]